jgi:hypothetical protein
VVREEAAGGRAALAVSRVVGGAGEARLAREEAEDGHVLPCVSRLPPVSLRSYRTSSIHSQHTRNLKYVETCVIQIPVDTLATQIPRGARGVPQCVLRPVRCVSRLPPVFWNRYARADDMVYIHTSQKVKEGRQSMVLRSVLERPVMILLRHLLFENLADRVELSVSS